MLSCKFLGYSVAKVKQWPVGHPCTAIGLQMPPPFPYCDYPYFGRSPLSLRIPQQTSFAIEK